MYGFSDKLGRSICPGTDVTYGTTPCTTTGTVGGCQKTSVTTCVMYWYFSPETTDTVQASCKAPDTYHAP